MYGLERFLEHVEQACASSGPNVLTGGFLSHRVDALALLGAAEAFAEQLPDADVLLTAEGAGIAPAFALALVLEVPFVIARRTAGRKPEDVFSTHDDDGQHLALAKDVLLPGQRVLLVSGLLGSGRVPLVLSSLASRAGANPVGLATFLEKTNDGGRNRLEVSGVPVFALVRLATDGERVFVERRVAKEGLRVQG